MKTGSSLFVVIKTIIGWPMLIIDIGVLLLVFLETIINVIITKLLCVLCVDKEDWKEYMTVKNILGLGILKIGKGLADIGNGLVHEDFEDFDEF